MKKEKKHFFIEIFIVFALIFTTEALPAMDEEDSEETPAPAGFEISGFISNKNIISTYTRQDADAINKKNEIRSSIKLRYGSDDFYILLNTNQYIMLLPVNEEYTYSGDFSISRNGTISGNFYEVNAREFYMNLSFEKIRFRAGNQVYGWGTADVFNPTSYFNPQDLREVFFRDEDELKQEVPSVSSMVFIGNWTLELVWVPVHVPGLVSAPDNFWEITYVEGPFPVHVINGDGLPVTPGNSGYGARLAGTILGADVSLSGYHGPDREALMRPRGTVLVTGEPVSVEVVPEYYIITSFGADASMRIDRIVVQAEAAFTPDRTVCIDQPYTTGMKLPFETDQVKSFSYAAGFNYFIPLSRIIEGHEGTTVFTAEWTQTVYQGSGYMKPLLSDIITARLDDSFFEDRFKPAVTVIWDTKNRGAAVSFRAAWDFQNGFSVNAQYWNISGRDDSVMGYFRDNDFVSIGGRYEF